MAPQARISFPPALQKLTKGEMERVIAQANIGEENEKIARLYYIDRMPQVEVAAEVYLAQATVKRRLPKIMEKMQIAQKRMKN
jgi:DNA-directed RNA polymerase specialized sigma subunit